MKDSQNLIDKILSEDNNENIVLYNENKEPVEFEQVAVIPLNHEDGTQSLYVLLHPAEPIPGVGDDEALVFAIDQDMDALVLEFDEAVVDKVFEEYYKLLTESGVLDKK